MPIAVECPCGAKLKAPDAAAGKRVKCPKCSDPITVPASEAGVEEVADRPKARPRREVEDNDRLRKKGNKKPEPNSNLPLLLGGGGVLALAVVGVVVTLVVLNNGSQAKATPTHDPAVPVLPSTPTPQVPTPPTTPQPTPPEPKPPEPKPPEPKPPEPKPIQPKPVEPKPVAKVPDAAPDFPLDPEPQYEDLTKEFAAALDKFCTVEFLNPRSKWGEFGRSYTGGMPRPKGAIPVVIVPGDLPSLPFDLNLPECKVPFAVNVDAASPDGEWLMKRLASQPNLEMVYGRLSVVMFKRLASSPCAANLKRLALGTTDEDTAVVLKLFPKVVELRLEISGPKTLEALAGATDLQHLYISSRVMTDADLAALAKLKDLRTLVVTGECPKLTAAGTLKAVARFDRLERLGLGSQKTFADGELTPLARLTRLRHLKVNAEVGEANATALSQLPHLTTLNCPNITAAGWKGLAAAPELKSLIFPMGQLPGVTAIARLEELDLGWWPRMTQDELAKIAAMPNLKRVSAGSYQPGPRRATGPWVLGQLPDSSFGDSQIRAFLEAGRLESLDVNSYGLTDTAFEKLGSAKGLKRLRIYTNDEKLTGAVLDRVAEVDTLEELSLPRLKNPSAESFAKLTKLTKLTSFEIILPSSDKRGRAEVEKLRKAMPNCVIRVTPG